MTTPAHLPLRRCSALTLAAAALIAVPVAGAVSGQHARSDRGAKAVQTKAQGDPLIQGEPKNQLPFTRLATRAG